MTPPMSQNIAVISGKAPPPPLPVNHPMLLATVSYPPVWLVQQRPLRRFPQPPECAAILLSRQLDSYRSRHARTRNFPSLAVSSKTCSSRGHNNGERILRPHTPRKRAGQAPHPHGALRHILPPPPP